MTYKLIIPGRLPSLNEYTDACRRDSNRNRYYSNAFKQNAQEQVEWAIRSQLKGVQVKPPVFLMYTFYEPNKKRDKDNIAGFAHKVIQDAMTAQGLLKNDGWAYIDGFQDSFEVSKENPRIEVRIEEI